MSCLAGPRRPQQQQRRYVSAQVHVPHHSACRTTAPNCQLVWHEPMANHPFDCIAPCATCITTRLPPASLCVCVCVWLCVCVFPHLCLMHRCGRRALEPLLRTLAALLLQGRGVALTAAGRGMHGRGRPGCYCHGSGCYCHGPGQAWLLPWGLAATARWPGVTWGHWSTGSTGTACT